MENPEGTNEKFEYSKIEDWSLGERYGLNMINDFNNGTVGFMDWNILLNEKGGPNHVGNYCYAPVHSVPISGGGHQLIYTNEFYYIGHFSKFVKPDAKRIASSSSRSQLLTTAFRNVDGTVAVIVMNSSEKEANYSLWFQGKAAKLKALPHSISTLIFKVDC